MMSTAAHRDEQQAPAAAAPDRRSARSSGRRRAAGPSDLLLLPALAFFGVFAVVPLIGVVVLSFTEWDGLGTPSFAGLDDWTAVLSDPVTWNAIKLTFLLTIVTYLVQFPLSLLLGTFMAGHQKYRELLSVLYFLPLLFACRRVSLAGQ